MGKFTRELEGAVPDGALLDLVLGVDPSTLSPEEKLTAIVAARRVMAALEYRELLLLRSFGDTTEVAMAVKEAEQSVVRRKQLGEALDTLPRLTELLWRGDIDLRRFDVVYNQVDPIGAERRHQKAKGDRRVELRPLPEGMAELRATLPAPEAAGLQPVHG